MAAIDYYLATISPFCYLAGQRLEEIAARHGASVTYRPIDPMALFPRVGGLLPKDRPPARIEYRAQELARWSKRLGMDLNLKPAHFPTNPAPSSYAVIAAQAKLAQGDADGDLPGLVHGVLRACWAEEKDIAEDAVIRAVLSANGFDPGLADSGLLLGAETYARNLEDGLAAGVFGAPFYIVRESDQRFWGQDRLDLLDEHLAELG